LYLSKNNFKRYICQLHYITEQNRALGKCFKVLQQRLEPLVVTFDGVSECCDPYLVLAHLTDNESWKNDVNSFWFKLDFSTEEVYFRLYNNNNELATYQADPVPFNADDLAYYATINWQQVLIYDGVGCYTVKIEHIINGVSTFYEQGEYDLKQYTNEIADGTIRLKANFNQYQAIEGIDFTGSNIIDAIRVNGFFGNKKTDLVVDNIINYGKIEKNVQRELLNKYVLETDPLLENFINRLTNLYFISEYELFVSDYNQFNHTYQYKDVPVIVSQSPELNYPDLSRLATIKIELTDKVKNKISKYNG